MTNRFPSAPTTGAILVAVVLSSSFSLAQSPADLTGEETPPAAQLTSGPFTIAPYGILWTNAIFETERTNGGDYVFYVLSPDTDGESAFHMDAKSTRIGLDIEGPQVCPGTCLDASVRIEVDFQGAFVVENKPGLLLRHAYWQLQNENVRLLAGQSWDVVSPLIPGMLMYTAGWGGGNIGYRRTQLRGELWSRRPASRFGVQLSVNANVVNDFAGSPTIDGHHSEFPMVQGRLAAGWGKASGPGLDLGASGHYGAQAFDFPPAGPGYDKRIDTWSINVDAHVRLSQTTGFKGEAFMGSNLSSMLGGVLHGVCGCKEKAVDTSGGWAEFYVRRHPVEAHAGFGIDDPDDADMGVDFARARNRFLFANLSLRATGQLSVGLEISHWRTEYIGLAMGESLHSNLVARYTF